MKAAQIVRNRRDGERGSLLIILAIIIPVVLGALGLVVDNAHLYKAKRDIQSAADAAVIAAAHELRKQNVQGFVQAAIEDAQLNGATEDKGAKIHVNHPPKSGRWAGNADYVEVVVEREVPTFFMRALGKTEVDVEARAVAGLIDRNVGIYVLEPTAPEALKVAKGSSFEIPDCEVFVNSKSSTAAVTKGSGTLTADRVEVAGGYDGSGFFPEPVVNSMQISDPLEDIAEPSIGGCDYYDTVTVRGKRTLRPGVYCGGIDVVDNGKAVFEPGTYVLRGGGLRVGKKCDPPDEEEVTADEGDDHGDSDKGDSDSDHGDSAKSDHGDSEKGGDHGDSASADDGDSGKSKDHGDSASADHGDSGGGGEDHGDSTKSDDDEGKKDHKVVICHEQSRRAHTIEIDRSALPAHLAHGDSVGECSDLCEVADNGDSDGGDHGDSAKSDHGDSGKSKDHGDSASADHGDSGGGGGEHEDSDGSKSSEGKSEKTCNASVKGSGVTFFLSESFGCGYGPVDIDESATVDLSAPTSGPFAGVLFYQDRDVDSGGKSILVSSSQNNLQGVAYFPTTDVELSGGKVTSTVQTKIVARRVELSGKVKLICPKSDSPFNPTALRRIAVSE